MKSQKFQIPMMVSKKAFGDIRYQGAFEVMEAQQDVYWFAKEVKVENDEADYKMNINEDELHLIKTTLQTFVELEQGVGTIWTKVAEWFPQSEIVGASMAIATMEMSVHAFFYQKMSDVMNIDPYETLEIQKNTKEIREKLNYLDEAVDSSGKDILLTLGTLAFIEQVLLFSNFAMLKSFQANGINKIINTMQGLDFVIQDEIIHGDFAAYLFKQMLIELKEANIPVDMRKLESNINKVALAIYDHEVAVVDMLFPDGKKINHISGSDIKGFLKERINHVFDLLGVCSDKKCEDIDNPISGWFFNNINSVALTDVFARGALYTRDWDEVGLSRLQFIDKEEK